MLPRLPAALSALVSLATVVTAACSGVKPSDDLMSRATGPVCGSELTPEAVAENEAITASLIARDECVPPVTGVVDNFVFPVVFNVIYTGEHIVEGNVTNEQIEAQIHVLNQDFTGTGLSFELAKTIRTHNQTWFDEVNLDNEEDEHMKTTLWKGNATTLYVYTVGFTYHLPKRSLGYATFPMDYELARAKDGAVINYRTLPDGSFTDYNEGHTLTHEVGHWVGLYHTFEGNNCYGPGDHVDDTPPESVSSSDCRVGFASCPGSPGDSVKNYMNYGNDTCVDNFTPGQIERLRKMVRCHRGIDFASPPQPQERLGSFLLDRIFTGWY